MLGNAESIQGDHLFKEPGTPVLCPNVNYNETSPFEYEYRFTEQDKNKWHPFLATVIPVEPKKEQSFEDTSHRIRPLRSMERELKLGGP
ncbi:MAG: hypothetical protein ACK5LQ_03455, partial [Planctomycetota bacterium]